MIGLRRLIIQNSIIKARFRAGFCLFKMNSFQLCAKNTTRLSEACLIRYKLTMLRPLMIAGIAAAAEQRFSNTLRMAT
jgi:hypothetical protein